MATEKEQAEREEAQAGQEHEQGQAAAEHELRHHHGEHTRDWRGRKYVNLHSHGWREQEKGDLKRGRDWHEFMHGRGETAPGEEGRRHAHGKHVREKMTQTMQQPGGAEPGQHASPHEDEPEYGEPESQVPGQNRAYMGRAYETVKGNRKFMLLAGILAALVIGSAIIAMVAPLSARKAAR